MKNQTFALSLFLTITFVMTSCGNKSTTQQTAPSSTAQTALDTSGSSNPVAMHYQCPMKCEGDKMYDKPGSCPVCKMDLKIVDGNHEHHHNDSTDHH